MCLTLAKKVGDKLPEEFTVYKLLKKNHSIWYPYEYKAGWNYPDEKNSTEEGILEGGCFHVFLSERDAKTWSYMTECRIEEIKVKKEDMVGAGYWDETTIPVAAFKRLFLEEDQIMK